MADEVMAVPPLAGRAVAWLVRALLVVAGVLLGVVVLGAQRASAAEPDPLGVGGLVAPVASTVDRVAALPPAIEVVSSAAGVPVAPAAGAVAPVASASARIRHCCFGFITLQFQLTFAGTCLTRCSSESGVGGVHAPPGQPRNRVAQTGFSSRPWSRMYSRFQNAPV